MNRPAGSCVRARVGEDAGVNVERPEPKARTNDVDAGAERRRISQEAPGWALLGRTTTTTRELQLSMVRGTRNKGTNQSRCTGYMIAPERDPLSSCDGGCESRGSMKQTKLWSRALFTVVLMAQAMALAACSSAPEVAVFKIAPGASRPMALGKDAPIIAARLHALGDTGASVVVKGETIVVQDGGRLPEPFPAWFDPGVFSLRPVLCGVASPLTQVPPVSEPLPACGAQYQLSATNLDVNVNTGAATNLIPADPAFANTADTVNVKPNSNALLLTAAGEPYPRLVVGPAQVTNSDIASAKAVYENPSWWVVVTFTSSGSAAYNRLSKEALHQYMAIVLDGVVISAPLVEPSQSTFSSLGNKLQIAGAFDRTNATQLGALLSFGALPVPLLREG